MTSEMKCPLCSGVLVREKNVMIQSGGSNVLNYTLAYVCKTCSTAYPIAIGSGGVIFKATPLYENGNRTK
jgi:DNA-directed RNA polymerase subunit RPC12/RpoP